MIRRAILVALLLLTSCHRHIAYRPVDLQTRIIKNFTPGITITKTVGETMIERADIKTYPGYEAAEDFSLPIIIKGAPIAPIISRGTRWKCNQFVEDYYRCSKIVLSGVNYDLAIDNSGVIFGYVWITSGRFTRFSTAIDGKLLPVDTPVPGSYKQELIYNGKSKDTIKVSYREYKDDLARPSFYQDLTYDLSESQEIAFRDLQIEVLEATNSTITFFVKK